MVKIKICGITNMKDAAEASKLGADYLGFIFYRNSPRNITMKKAREIITNLNNPKIRKVGVFVNESIRAVNKTLQFCGLDLAQLHGDETEEYCRMLDAHLIKAFRIKKKEDIMNKIKNYNTQYIMLDTYSENFGGAGKRFDWSIAKQVIKRKKTFLAGGINERNIEEAILLRPYAVDVCSGAELFPGKKDLRKMKAIIEKVRKI